MSKFFLIYLIYQLVDLSLQEEDIIKPLIECVHGHVIPHPTNCKKFIKCGRTDSHNIILECASSTLFNPDTGFCEFPQNVTCRIYEYVTRKPLLLVNLVPPTIEYFYCKPGCLKPHPDDCSKFILCGNKLSENKIFKCPKSLLYNPYIKSCDIPQNVVCKTYNYEFLTFPNQENSTKIPITSTTTIISSTTNIVSSSSLSSTISQSITTSFVITTTPITTRTTQKSSTTLTTISSTTYKESTINELTSILTTVLTVATSIKNSSTSSTASTTIKTLDVTQETTIKTTLAETTSVTFTSVNAKETIETSSFYKIFTSESTTQQFNNTYLTSIGISQTSSSHQTNTKNNTNQTTVDYTRETAFNYYNLTTATSFNLTQSFNNNTSDYLNQTTIGHRTTNEFTDTTNQYNLTTLIFNLTTLNLISSTLYNLNLNQTNTFNSTDFFYYLNETTPTFNQTSVQIDKPTSVNPLANNHTKNFNSTNPPLLKTTTVVSDVNLNRQANCTTNRNKNVPNIYFRENGFYLANGTIMSSFGSGRKHIYRKKLTKDYQYDELPKFLKSIFISHQYNDHNNNNHQEDNFEN